MKGYKMEVTIINPIMTGFYFAIGFGLFSLIATVIVFIAMAIKCLLFG
jgi:hypothetical protein